MMQTEKLLLEIFADPKDQSRVTAMCEGPDSFGRCSQTRQDGTVFCRGQYLRVNDGSRWIWSVDPRATICPVKQLR